MFILVNRAYTDKDDFRPISPSPSRYHVGVPSSSHSSEDITDAVLSDKVTPHEKYPPPFTESAAARMQSESLRKWKKTP